MDEIRVFDNQIMFEELGYFTAGQIRKIFNKVSNQLYRNISLIYQETEVGYILGLSTNIEGKDSELKNYFYKVVLTNL